MSSKARKKFIVPENVKQEGRNFRSGPQSCEGEYLCWRFSIMDMGGPFSFADVKAKTWQRILEKMRQWDSMTWGEIEGDDNHAVAVAQLSSKAQKRLLEIGQDDIDEIFSLRLIGRERLIGIRDRHVFRVLWWDPYHQVCPSRKKHT